MACPPALFPSSSALTYLPAWLQLDPDKLEQLNIPLPKGRLLYMEDCKRQFGSSSHAIERASGLDPTDFGRSTRMPAAPQAGWPRG